MEYFFSIFFGTFILEDVALVTAFKFIADGRLTLVQGFLACFLGISVGDIGLYFIGRFANFLGLEARIKTNRNIKMKLQKMKSSHFLDYMIFISRFIPGTRIPTYVGAGVLNYSFIKFTSFTLISVAIWVGFALVAGQSLYYLFMNDLVLALVLFIVFMLLLKRIGPVLTDSWKRKATFHFWRKWMSFEFWPAWFFYIPIYVWYVIMAIKHRSFLNPFYANPKILNGGLIGESKWDFLQYLDPRAKSTLKALKVNRGTDFSEFIEILEKNQYTFPFIVKPDVGQRGFGVRIIRDEFDLTEYLLLSDFDIILQKLSSLKQEAGIFYIKIPDTGAESIFSITDKSFPFVVGDGETKLGDLILGDSRAKIIAQTYFDRHEDSLDQVIAKGAVFQLSECGNHCQGAIFHNGINLKTEKLLQEISKIAQQVPEFYFGRFDIRYDNADSLKNGEFEIIEINGAGSEATHIWDARTTLSEAYSTLFKQWNLLFTIGGQVKRKSDFKSNLRLGLFFTESLRVYFRKEKLSVSS